MKAGSVYTVPSCKNIFILVALRTMRESGIGFTLGEGQRGRNELLLDLNLNQQWTEI